MGRSSSFADLVEDDEADLEPARPARSNAPKMEEIPLPPFRLSIEAEAIYWRHAQQLVDLGKLNEFSYEAVKQLAVATQEFNAKVSKGGSTRYERESINRSLRKLEPLYDEDPASASGRQSQDAYAHFGFARRARQRLHGRD